MDGAARPSARRAAEYHRAGGIDAKAPLRIKWLADSYIDIPIWR